MNFYKFILKTGHAKNLKHYGELAVYIHANSYMQALDSAKKFPMVKHGNSSVIINSREIDEREYVLGILHSGYEKVMYGNAGLPALNRIARKLGYIKNYEFVSEEGARLKSLCDTYVNASDKVKPMIEKEYINWAQSLDYTDNTNFGY